MTRTHLALPVLSLLALAACDRNADDDATAPVANELVVPPGEVTPPPPPAPDNAADPAVAPNTLPLAMRGRWTGVSDDCGAPGADLGLTASADTLRFYESEGTITSVRPDGPGAVVADVGYRGEGESWTRRQRISLSPDGDRLTISGEGVTTVRKLCR